MKRTLALVLFLAHASAGLSFAQLRSVVIQDTNFIDGKTGALQAGVSIVLEGDRVRVVGSADRIVVPEGARVIDGKGKWVLPGFVDVHTHYSSEEALRKYLATGFTTIHLMASSLPNDPRQLELHSHSPETPSPRLHVSPYFSGEFPRNVVPQLEIFKPQTAEDARRMVRKCKHAGFRQIKIIQDDGILWTGSEKVPRLRPELFSALVEEASTLDMRVYVHATQLVDTREAVLTGANAFMYGTMDTRVDEQLWEEMQARNIVWTPTHRVVLANGDPQAYARRVLSDENFRKRLSGNALTYYEERAAGVPVANPIFPGLAPDLPALWKHLQENTREAQARGVPIALGSDGGPVGIGSHLEMEFLQEAGLTPVEVLVAATYGGAIALGVEKEIGSIEPGKLADLVILTVNPLEDARNARAIEWVIKGGVPRKPEDLVSFATEQD